MKVYLVYWCNNEPYEDYCETVDAVFSTREKAEEHITAKKGYRPRKCVGEWEKAHLAGRFDKVIDQYETWSMWVREMEVVE